MNKTIFIITFSGLLLLLYMVSFFIDRASNNGICFGVRLPKEYIDNEEIRHIRKQYKTIVSIMFIAIFIIINGVVLFGSYVSDNLQVIMTLGSIGAIVLFELAYVPFYFKVKKLKKERGWTYKTRNVVVVDTSLIKPSKNETIKTISSRWFLLLLLIPISLAVLTYVKTRKLPLIMEVPNLSNTVIDRGSFQGIIKLYGVPLYEGATCIFMYFINYIVVKARPDLNSGDIEHAVIRKKKFRRVNSIFIFILTICIMALYSVNQFEILYNVKLTQVYNIFNIMTAAVSFIFIGVLIWIGQGGRKINEASEGDDLYKDDDDKWILGDIYFNPKDPAWMVEKRRGIGWTFNFGNVKSLIAFIILIIVIIISKIVF